MSGYEGVRVLVTGASGFLGSHTAARLVSAGADVHAVCRASSSLNRLADAVDGVTVHRADVTDFPALLGAFNAARPGVVFHLAGDTSARRSEGGWNAIERSIAVNFLGTINVVKAASECVAKVRTMVRVGGLEEYGRSSIPYTEGDREQPVSAYSASQVAATHFCQSIQRDLGFQVVNLRPALVYGPAQSQRFFIPGLIEACLSGRPFEMTDGTQTRDLIYIDDVVEGILLAASTPGIRGGVINLATGVEHSISQVTDLVLQITRASIDVRRGALPTGHSDLQRLVGSTEHAARTLGWSFRTPLGVGLEKTVDWHRGQTTNQTDNAANPQRARRDAGASSSSGR
ncbi:MAG TPA: SDR family NAD(P)-dependent oxidoreductase [Gemmatimonadaceae bacterium]|nr:SDR family NAD(P)-dependent oxidoreductase [Gemmatimonadaceae bacterium]